MKKIRSFLGEVMLFIAVIATLTVFSYFIYSGISNVLFYFNNDESVHSIFTLGIAKIISSFLFGAIAGFIPYRIAWLLLGIK